MIPGASPSSRFPQRHGGFPGPAVGFVVNPRSQRETTAGPWFV